MLRSAGFWVHSTGLLASVTRDEGGIQHLRLTGRPCQPHCRGLKAPDGASWGAA